MRPTCTKSVRHPSNCRSSECAIVRTMCLFTFRDTHVSFILLSIMVQRARKQSHIVPTNSANTVTIGSKVPVLDDPCSLLPPSVRHFTFSFTDLSCASMTFHGFPFNDAILHIHHQCSLYYCICYVSFPYLLRIFRLYIIIFYYCT